MSGRTIKFTAGAGLLLLLASGLVAADDDPQELRHNPFSRPPSEGKAAAISDGRSSTVAAADIDLRATMVATNDKLANIDGRIVRPGDEVQGYRLLQVFEDRVVISRGGRRLTMYVKPDVVETND